MKTLSVLRRCGSFLWHVCAAAFLACLLLVVAMGWRPLGQLDFVQVTVRYTTPPRGEGPVVAPHGAPGASTVLRTGLSYGTTP